MPPKLPRYDLVKNQDTDKWDLNRGQETVKSWGEKADAVKGGALKKAVGENGGTVRIHKQRGPIQEERTFPRSRDPKKSKG